MKKLIFCLIILTSCVTFERASNNHIKSCYENALRRNRNLAGKLTVTFVVGPDGRVKSSFIKKSTITDSIMEECILNVVNRWEFPKPKGGKEVTVNYPFSFNPQ